MNNDTLAAFLGCDLDTLPSLALCGRPETGSPTFGRDADEIARAFGVSTLQLVRLLRRVDANTAVRGAGAPDILTAARDRDEGEDASGEADRARDD